MSASETITPQEENEEERLIREKIEKKVRKKLQKKKGGITKISEEDRKIVLANKEKTLALVERVKNNFRIYRQLRVQVNEAYKAAARLSKRRQRYDIDARKALNELVELNPGCCRYCGIMGGHPKKFGCGDCHYCEDNAYRSTNSCYPPLYWGREFSEEEYKQLYCHRHNIYESHTSPPASDSDYSYPSDSETEDEEEE